jgi:2-phosphosulfolactate phosphatase
MTHTPTLHTVLSPALLDLYDVQEAIVVVIDVLRATSTIATALYNGAACVIPVDNIPTCIALGKELNAITAGEREGRIAEGLLYGNSPFEYPSSFIANKTLVLTTTNGTKLLHSALRMGAANIITGAFVNLSAVTAFLINQQKPVLLACAAWKDKINIEDSLLAGAIIKAVQPYFSIVCDASQMAVAMYQQAEENVYQFMLQKNASHYHRLNSYGLEKDIRYCLTPNVADVLPVYDNGRLMLRAS